MATFYLPSSTTGYATENDKVLFRIIVIEAHNASAGRRLRVRVYAYRTDTYTTDGQGSVTIYIDDTQKFKKSFEYGTYPITSSGVYIADEYISLSSTATTAKVTAKLSLPNTTAGTATNGGSITLSVHTVAYNANGGSGAPSSQTKVQGIALSLSNTIPTRSGYVFKNWNTKSDGSGTSWASGANYTPDQQGGTVTLYAQWEESASSTIIFNANGGSNVPSNIVTSATSVIIPSIIPTRTGYTFTSWNTSQNGSGTSYTSGSSISISTNDSVVLYAQWEAINPDIYIYKSDLSCAAIEFVESDAMFGFDKDGFVYAPEFVEGTEIIIDKTKMQFGILKQK